MAILILAIEVCESAGLCLFACEDEMAPVQM